jgi:hypothetical protein
MPISPTESCNPEYSVFEFSGQNGCCELIFTYNQSVGIPPACSPPTTYYPNRCTANPRTALGTIGPMIVPMTIDFDVLVDDEAIVDGATYQPGSFIVTLGAGLNGATCTTFPGGASSCNGQHTAKGSVTKIVNETFTFQAGDNHGIQCFGNGTFKAKFAGPP